MSTDDPAENRTRAELDLKLAELIKRHADLELQLKSTSENMAEWRNQKEFELKLDELKIKAETLALEKEKFLYTRSRGWPDRLGAAMTRAMTAVLFANGSAIIVCLNSYKSLVENLTKTIVDKSIYVMAYGFLSGTIAFIFALHLTIGRHDFTYERDRTFTPILTTIFIFGGVSYLAFVFAIGQALDFLTNK